MSRLHSIVYVSHALEKLSDAELEKILETSVRNNDRDGITGALLHRDCNFMQCLEGEEAAVRATYARIERDKRHSGLMVLMDEPIIERAFPMWSMAQLQPTKSELLSLSTTDWEISADAAPGTASPGFIALKAFADRYRR